MIEEGANSLFERIASRSHAAASQIHVRSALNPMLWLCAIISIPCLFGAWSAHGVEPIATILAYVGVAPVGVTCIMAIYFAMFRPDKLQSEDYQIRHETIELIRQKGSSIEIAPSSLEAVSNPVQQRQIGAQK